MKNSNTQHDPNNANYLHLIIKKITPLDLFIISKLNQGLSVKEVEESAKKEFDMQTNKMRIKERLDKLISEDEPNKRIILNSTPQLFVDPTKLYSTISFVLIKAETDIFYQKNMHISLENIFDTIININNKPQYEQPLKFLFKTTGWIFDFVGIIFCNNKEKFFAFRDHLINQGIIKTMEIVPVDLQNNLLYKLNDQPDYQDFRQFLIHYQQQMNSIIDELTGKDQMMKETMRFFEKSEYGLKEVSGKDIGDIYLIDKSEIKIGRYYDNDIIIDDLVVSRRHAKIVKINDNYILHDQSTNGTYINDKKLIYEEKTLKDGDIITIGKKKFQFQNLVENQ